MLFIVGQISKPEQLTAILANNKWGLDGQELQQPYCLPLLGNAAVYEILNKFWSNCCCIKFIMTSDVDSCPKRQFISKFITDSGRKYFKIDMDADVDIIYDAYHNNNFPHETSSSVTGVAANYIGLYYCIKNDYNKMIAWTKIGCEKKDPLALFNMGLNLLVGVNGLVEKDHKKAVEYLEKSGELGFAGAYTKLGTHYCGAYGHHPSDFEKALKSYKKAVSMNDNEACFILASFYLSPQNYGNFVLLNNSEYFRLTYKAYELKHKGAEFSVANCYMTGLGVAQDFAKGVKMLENCALHDANINASITLMRVYHRFEHRNYNNAILYAKNTLELADDTQTELSLECKNVLKSIARDYIKGVNVEKNIYAAIEIYNDLRSFDVDVSKEINDLIVDHDLLEKIIVSHNRVKELEEINAHLAASPCGDYKKAMEDFNKSVDLTKK